MRPRDALVQTNRHPERMYGSIDSLPGSGERKAAVTPSLHGWLLAGVLLFFVCAVVPACDMVDDNEAERETEEEVEEGVPRPPGRP